MFVCWHCVPLVLVLCVFQPVLLAVVYAVHLPRHFCVAGVVCMFVSLVSALPALVSLAEDPGYPVQLGLAGVISVS